MKVSFSPEESISHMVIFKPTLLEWLRGFNFIVDIYKGTRSNKQYDRQVRLKADVIVVKDEKEEQHSDFFKI